MTSLELHYNCSGQHSTGYNYNNNTHIYIVPYANLHSYITEFLTTEVMQ